MSIQVTESEPTLGDIARLLWAARKRLFAGAILGLACGFIFLVCAIPHYRVSMVLAPADRAPKADIKALLPDNPSFALQYLVNSVGAQDSSEFLRFENMLRGPGVAAVLLKDKRIVDGVVKNKPFIFSAAKRADTAQELSDIFMDEVVIEPVGNTPLRRVFIDTAQPEFGVYLMNQIYNQTDALIRDAIEQQAQSRAVYLRETLGKVSNPDHRRALTSLLMEQEHIQMILAADEPYAAMIVEQASISSRPVWPRRTLILAGFAFVGMILMFVLVRKP